MKRQWDMLHLRTMKSASVIFLLLCCSNYYWTKCSAVGTAKKCIKVTSIITSFGDGSTEDSCMGCDPARPDCAVGCQKLVDSMYLKCDGVCMPDGYYYDPLSTVTGCWEEVKPLLKIGVERCGCNAAFHTSPLLVPLFAAITLFCAWLLV